MHFLVCNHLAHTLSTALNHSHNLSSTHWPPFSRHWPHGAPQREGDHFLLGGKNGLIFLLASLCAIEWMNVKLILKIDAVLCSSSPEPTTKWTRMKNSGNLWWFFSIFCPFHWVSRGKIQHENKLTFTGTCFLTQCLHFEVLQLDFFRWKVAGWSFLHFTTLFTHFWDE